MTRAYAYARYSTDRQSEASIADQLRVCREWAARAELAIAGEFVDEGISGAALGNRPGVLKALAAPRAGDVLLVCDLTRLSRSQGDLAKEIDRLVARGVRVVGVQDGYDSSRRGHKLQAGVAGIVGEAFREMISDRTYTALETRARAGRATGGRAYGYTPDGVPLDPEAAIVREVFRRAAAGEALTAIAADLNARGIPSPGAAWARAARTRAGRWQVSALHEMLGNERYIGRVIWNRSRWVKNPDTGARERRERPREEWIVAEGARLVDAATWDAVQALRSGRKAFGGGRGGGPKYLLSGVLVCGECGTPMVVSGRGGSHYYCATRKTSGQALCTNDVGTRRDVAEEIVLGRVQRFVLSPEAVEHALATMRKLRRQRRTQAVQEAPPAVRALEAELAELTAIAAERPGLAALRAAVADVETRLAAARRDAWRAVTSGDPVDDGELEEAYRDHARRMRLVLLEASAPARTLIREMVPPVRLRPDPSRSYLVAEGVGIDPTPLIRAAGPFLGMVAGACFGTVETGRAEFRRAA